jgi:hypothetical protein
VVRIHSPRPLFSIRYLPFEINEKATAGDFVGGEILRVQQPFKGSNFRIAMQWEIVTEISVLHAKTGLEQEKRLLGTIEGYKWGKTVNDYMTANLNTGFITCDSSAMSQGVHVPAHLYFAAVAFEKESQCAAVREFLDMSIRLLRQIEVNALNSETGSPSDQYPIKAVLAICDRFHEVARQLTHRRENRGTLEIKDEYDVQDLLHALLHIHVDDIRPEEWTPSDADVDVPARGVAFASARMAPAKSSVSKK